MTNLETTAALDRLDGLVTAFLQSERTQDAIETTIRCREYLDVKTVEMLLSCAYQSAYICGHQDGMSHAAKVAERHISKIIEGSK